MITIEWDDPGEQVRVGGVALGPGGGVPLPVPGRRQWVDREHLVSGCAQRRDPRTAVGLDTHYRLSRHLLRRQLSPRRRGVLGDQRVQPGDAFKALRQSCPHQPATILVLDLDVVMILSPVISDEQHPQQLLQIADTTQHPETPAT